MNKKINSYFFLLFVGLILTSSCQITPRITVANNNQVENKLKNINTLYIEQVLGSQSDLVRDILIENLKKTGLYKIVEYAPLSPGSVAYVTFKSQELISWETDEIVPAVAPQKQPIPLLRRNLNYVADITVRSAETGKLLFQQTISQPFQQIYLGEKSIEKRPPIELEQKRIIYLTLARLSNMLNFKKADKSYLLERGSISDYFGMYNLFTNRLAKGNSMAVNHSYKKALSTWNVATFEAELDKSVQDFMIDRASAYYNMGVVKKIQKKWFSAAIMFAKANLAFPKLKYAQAWADSMQKWKDQGFPAPKSKYSNLKDLENPLMLNPQKLWPLVKIPFNGKETNRLNNQKNSILPKKVKSPEKDILDLK